MSPKALCDLLIQFQCKADFGSDFTKPEAFSAKFCASNFASLACQRLAPFLSLIWVSISISFPIWISIDGSISNVARSLADLGALIWAICQSNARHSKPTNERRVCLFVCLYVCFFGAPSESCLGIRLVSIVGFPVGFCGLLDKNPPKCNEISAATKTCSHRDRQSPSRQMIARYHEQSFVCELGFKIVSATRYNV